MSQIIECVPNFSEGRDLSIIKQITNEIESVEGVKLLKSYQFSKKQEDIFISNYYQVEMFTKDKITLKNDSFENWETCSLREIDFISLCADVNNILDKINNERVSEQLKRYAKQSHISKSVLENNPELVYIHEKIETLKKFQTHIKTK